MASAAVSPVVPDRPSPVSDDAFRLVPWASCVASPLNPRKHFDPDGLKELAGTMGSDVGVIEPLVVRPSKNKGQFEIVAGERRWRAAELAGLTQVPVIVREGLTDIQVLRMMVIENKQRKDLNALEEGEGFYQLTKRGVQIDAIAGDIKASRKYVYDRIKLRDLSPVGQQLLVAGRITAGHAILIARLSDEQQKRVLEFDDVHDSPLFEVEGGVCAPRDEDAEEKAQEKDPYVGTKTCTVRELDGWISQHVRFDAKTTVNRELYPETAAAVEQAEKVVQITRNHYTQPDAKSGNTQRIYHSSSWKRADGELDYENFSGSGKPKASKTCDRSVLGVVVAGPGRGEAFKVCVNKDCDVHWKAERQAREKQARRQTASSSRFEKQQEQQRRRDEERRKREDEERAAYRKAKPSILDAVVTKLRAASPKSLSVLFVRDAGLAGALKLLELTSPSADDLLRAYVLASVMRAFGNEWWVARNLAPWAKALSIDLKPLLAAVQTSAPAAGAEQSPQSRGRAKASTKKR
jgi:ParB/RepB/Spo0J family partition protein